MLELIKLIRKFDGLNLITLLSEIITSSFVLGFLPILAFFFITLKIPKFTNLTSFFSTSSLVMISERCVIKFKSSNFLINFINSNISNINEET